VYQGAVVQWPVRIYNVGDKPLHIEDVNVTCNCARVSMAQRTILPGASAEMHVVFNSAGREGSVGKELLVVSDDLPQRNLFIDFLVTVVPPLGLSAEAVQLSRTTGAASGEASFTVTNNWNRRLNIIGIQDHENIIACTADRTSLAPNESATISLYVQKMPNAGKESWVEINTDVPASPSRKIAVTF
jgi:hypothetical protein